MIIRQATIRDLDAIDYLEHKCFDERDSVSRGYIAQDLSSDTYVYLLASSTSILGNRHVGYAQVSFGIQIAQLWSLCSIERGVGRKLLQAAEHVAAKRGKRTLRLKVRASNERAIGLYEKSGYKRYGGVVHYLDGEPALRYEKRCVFK
jgi:ribosomal protein S18 acetylase RimI-like enzyme